MMSALYVEVVVKIQGRKSLREGREGKETGKGMWIESRFGGIDSLGIKLNIYLFILISSLEWRIQIPTTKPKMKVHQLLERISERHSYQKKVQQESSLLLKNDQKRNHWKGHQELSSRRYQTRQGRLIYWSRLWKACRS